jgi:branched-chain amino acid transport system substrate-binding protein
MFKPAFIFSTLTFVVALILGVASANAYIKSNNKQLSSPKTQQIKIGLITEVSGKMAAYGASSQKGAELAIAQANFSGGIKIGTQTYSLILETKDAQDSTEIVQKAVEDFAKEKVQAVIAPSSAKLALAGAEAAEKNKVLYINPWASDADITLNTSGKHNKYSFRVSYIDTQEIDKLCSFVIKELDKEKAIVLFDNSNNDLQTQAEIFNKTYQKKGGKIVASESFNTDDYKTALSILSKNKPDVVFLSANYTDAIEIIQAAKNSKIKTTFVGTNYWQGNQILNLCESDCASNYFTSSLSYDKTDMSKKFTQTFKNKYGYLPDDIAATSYDAVITVLQNIKETNALDSGNLAAGIKEFLKVEGATGQINFNPGMLDPEKNVYIYKIDQNNLKIID